MVGQAVHFAAAAAVLFFVFVVSLLGSSARVPLVLF